MYHVEVLPAPVLPPHVEGKWEQERRAYYRLLPELLTTHRGQCVAIHEGQMVESGDDEVDVALRAYARFGYIPIFVSRVQELPVAPIRIPSPRIIGPIK